MSCLFPLPMARDEHGNVISIKKTVLGGNVIHVPSGDRHTEFYVPCGQCGECRLSRARMWATRCVHEATMWQKTSFITLTYKQIPPGGSLEPEAARNFIRNLRYKLKAPFKYFLVGEYGDEGNRPHYHALIFGHDFGLSNYYEVDSKKKQTTDLGVLHDTEAMDCPELSSIWGLGHTSVGRLTFDSAAYCAQYAMKKVNGEKAKDHYGGRYPEFMRTSQNAIGKQYALQFADEIILNNSVISNGVEQPIPQYYIKQYEKQNKDLTNLKLKREEFSQTHTLEKSYIRAQMLDSKFKLRVSKADAFRVRYISEKFFKETLTPLPKK